jgi:decaprenyl-phosphate phosphoribosyltransferase
VVATPAAPAAGAELRTGSLAFGLVLAARPKQWVKNVLVLAAPASAGELWHGSVAVKTAVAVVAFVLASSGTYLVNDAADVAADRLHPSKRLRPIASGVVPVATARVVGVALMAVAVAAGGLLTDWRLAVVLGSYVVLQLAYSSWLKHVAVVELVCVALGFVLRAIAGGAATRIELSEWFLIVASFGSLFMVIGKRYAEATGLDDGGVTARRILAEYPVSWLRQMRDTCVAVTLLAYCLFAFERASVPGPHQSHRALTLPWYELSIVPVTVGLLRYALQVERGHGAAPEDLVLRDGVLIAAGLVWAVLFGLGVVRA